MTSTTLELVRKDMLPEGTTYTDDGCSIAPSCLECPKLVCKYDEPHAGHTFRIQRSKNRATDIRSLRKRGMPLAEIAQRVGVSLRTVARALADKKVAK